MEGLGTMGFGLGLGSGSGAGGGSSGSGSAVVEPDFVLPADIGRMAKCGRSTVNSAFSAKDMASAAQGFGVRELEWVYDIGLAGLPRIDCFTHFNRDHSFFLLQCVDSRKKSLVVGQGITVPICGENMCAILGLRDGGSVDVEHVDGDPLPAEVYAARLVLGMNLNHLVFDTSFLLSIVKETHDGEMDEFQVTRFKLAYAMLAESVFIRPAEKRRVVTRDAYRLAAVAAHLDKLNWGKRCALGIIDGGRQVQEDMRLRTRGFNVYGCLYALEVMYFDTVAGGLYAVNPGVLPRIGQYDVSTLMSLINNDTLKLTSEKVYGMFMRNFVVTPLVGPGGGRARTPIQDASAPGPASNQALVVRAVTERTGEGVASSTTHHVEDPAIKKLIESADEWLKNGVDAEIFRSKERTKQFFIELTVCIQNGDRGVNDKLDAHDKREEWLRLVNLKYLLEHLMSKGVGNYAPSLQQQLVQTSSMIESCAPSLLSACTRTGLSFPELVNPLIYEGISMGQHMTRESVPESSASGMLRGEFPLVGTPVINALPLRAVATGLSLGTAGSSSHYVRPTVIGGSLSASLGGGSGTADRRHRHDGNIIEICTPPTSVLPPKKRMNHFGDIGMDNETNEMIVYTATKSKRARIEMDYVLLDRKMVTNTVRGQNPFSENFVFPYPSSEKAELAYSNMIYARQCDMSRLWVIHQDPTLLKMNGFEMLTEFHRYGALGRKGYNVATRMIDVTEASWYQHGDGSRWRCRLPLEWTEEVLCGGNCMDSKKIKDMFTGSGIKFDMETCQLVWAPHMTPTGFMVLYGFDFVLGLVHVWDPFRALAGKEILESIHFDSCDRLLQAMSICVESCFYGWEVDQSNWQFVCHDYSNGQIESSDAVLYVLHIMMFFDGLMVTKSLRNDELHIMKCKLMMMVLNMAGNVGHAPGYVKNPIASIAR